MEIRLETQTPIESVPRVLSDHNTIAHNPLWYIAYRFMVNGFALRILNMSTIDHISEQLYCIGPQAQVGTDNRPI